MQGQACMRMQPPPSHHILLLTLALISAALLPTATLGVSPPRIPSDINQWTYDTQPNRPPLTRLWDRSTLSNAARVNSFEQLRPLLEKLNAGQPITVLAFGDSITADHGGCYHRDLEHRKRHVAFLRRPDMTSFCTTPYMPWLTNFMRMVNATWPHPDHLLVNLGIPASSFYTITESECLELYVPHHVDLLVLEHLPYLETPKTVLAAERLLHRLWLHFRPTLPAVIFLNMHLAINSKIGEPMDNCIRNMARCSAECPTSFQGMPHPDSMFKPAEVQTHSVATYYGFASFSHPAMIHSLVRDHVPERMGGMSECELWATLYSDHVHPNVTGRLLLTDLLVNYLASGEEYFVAQAAEPSHSHNLEGRLLPLQPLEPDSFLVPRMHCFYSAAATGEDHVGSMATSLPVMKMDKADGWAFVERDGESQKFKPGWVATAPGSVLWISLPLDFPSPPVHHPATRRLSKWHSVSHTSGLQGSGAAVGGSGGGLSGPAAPVAPGDTLSIILTFLRSYQHMGKATVTCLEGCACRAYELDGHEPHLVHSIPMMLPLQATVTKANTNCVLEVKVLPESPSGEHKVKVIQVSVGALINMTHELTALAHRSALQRKSHITFS